MKAHSLLAAALCALPLLAGAADGGIYLGAGAGRGHIEDNPRSFDSTDTAYKGFVGYRFGGLPLIDLAAEIGYVNFGHPAQAVAGQTFEYQLRGGTAAGLVIIPVGPIDLIGKVGAIRWTLERNAGSTPSSHTSTSAFGGAGIGFRLWKLGLRAEYEYFDIKGVDRASLLSVSALFQF